MGGVGEGGWRWGSGTHFTNDFSITIQIRWKFHLALIQLLVIISRQNLAHATAAQLSCHVPKYCSDHYIIIWMRAKWNFHHIWIVMEKLLVKWAPDPYPQCNEHFLLVKLSCCRQYCIDYILGPHMHLLYWLMVVPSHDTLYSQWMFISK